MRIPPDARLVPAHPHRATLRVAMNRWTHLIALDAATLNRDAA